jgi:predicted dithiol-disulfide oxidoreductase (DUF899 family)
MRKAMKKKTSKTAAKRSRHQTRYPGENAKYRAARDTLLKAEADLRAQVERVAALRRRLPPGGPTAEDYVFDEGTGRVRLSELFSSDKNTLIAYSFMFGPAMAAPCPMCTSILDSLDGAAPHIAQRANLVVVAKSPIERIREFARERGWRNLRLLSSAGTTYNRDYHGEDANGAQWPTLNVFIRRGRQIHHSYGSELLFMQAPKGQDARHVDMIWPLWNLLDLTPEGRGTSWYPRLRYDA